MTTTTPNTLPSEAEAIRDLLQRAEAGDLSTVPALRRLLEQRPALWQRVGDLAFEAQEALVRLAAGANLLLSESLTRKLASLKEELAGSKASPLERLLAERVSFGWLEVAYLDALSVQGRDLSAKQADDLRRRRDSAHRRLLAAARQLAVVTKLLRPALSPLQLAAGTVPESPPPRRDRGFARAELVGSFN